MITRTAGGSGAKRPRRKMKKYGKLTPTERRQIRFETGLQKDIAAKFGVSRNYVCILKSGLRPIRFTPAEVLGAVLVSMACGVQ